MTAPDVTPRVTLDEIRERHRKHDDWYCEAGELISAGQDQCDTRIVLDALDEMTSFAENTAGDNIRARADADRLAEALRDTPSSGGICQLTDRQHAALAAHDALIHPPDAAEYNPCVGGED